MRPDHKFFPWFLLIILAIIWGSSFILMKRGLEAYSFQEVGALRISIAFLSLLPIAIRHLSKIKKADIAPLILTGLLGNAIPAFLFPKAETQLDSSIVGTLNALVPLFALIVGLIWFKQRVKWYNVIGILIGLTGAAWLMRPDQANTNGNASYGLFAVAATVCYALSVNIVKSKLANMKSLAITAVSFFFIGVPGLIYLLIGTDFTSTIQHHPGALSALGYIAILAIMGTSVALILFNELVKISTPIFASSVTYLIPVIAILWGIIDGETLQTYQFIGVAIILAGVYGVNKN